MTAGDFTPPPGLGVQPRPMNAPPAQPLSIGVQPGTQSIVKAQYVIIFGTAGGLFVYSGTPAKGTLIASIAAVAGTDPYGNNYEQGFATYGSQYVSALFGGVLQFLNHASPPVANPTVQGQPAAAGSSLTLLSGTGTGATDAQLVLLDSQASGSGQPEIDVTAPIIADSWNSMTYASGWTGNGYYRLLPTGDVELAGTANGSAPNSSPTIATLPAGYAAQHTQCYSGAGLQTAGAYTDPGVNLNTAGVLAFTSTAGSGAVTYRLDGIILPISRP